MKKYRVVLVWIVMGVFSLGILEAMGKEPLPTAVAVKTLSPPVIDGKLNDACWNKAAKLTNFRLHTGKGPATEQTEAYLLYDDKNLYVGFRCFESEIDKLQFKSSRRIYKGDSVEIFLDTNNDRTNFIHIVANARGDVCHLTRPEATKGGEFSYEDTKLPLPATRAKGSIEEKFWTVEIVIPLVTLKVTTDTGSLWGINLCREHHRKKEYSCWSCTYGSFTNVSRFGYLKGINVDFKRYCYSLQPSLHEGIVLGENIIAKLRNDSEKSRDIVVVTEVAPPSRKIEKRINKIRLKGGARLNIKGETRERGTYKFRVTVIEPEKKEILYRSGLKTFSVPSDLFTFTLNQKYYSKEKYLEARAQITTTKERLKNLKMKLELKDATSGKVIKEKTVKRLSPVTKARFNISRLPLGKYTVSASLAEDITKAQYAFHKTKGYGRRPKIEIDKESHALLVDGKPFFPIGIAHPGNEEGVKACKEQGFNTVWLHPRIWGKYIDPRREPDWGVIGARLENFINSCHANKLFGMIDLGSFMRYNKWEKMKEFISKYKEHPTVLVWQPMDEPGPGLIPDLLKTYNFVKSIDLSHPIIVNLGWSGMMCPDKYKDGCDILMTDPYPIRKDSANLLMVADYTDRIVKAVDNEKPVWIWLQAYEWSGDSSLLPTPLQERCMSYLAIIHGAKGLFYFSYRQMMRKEKPALWNSLKSLTAELKKMAPIILAPKPKQKIELIPKDSSLQYLLKEYKGKKYIFAANPVEKEVTVTFKLPGLKRRAKLSVLFEDREAPRLTGNSFTDTFSKYAVHIYEIK